MSLFLLLDEIAQHSSEECIPWRMLRRKPRPEITDFGEEEPELHLSDLVYDEDSFNLVIEESPTSTQNQDFPSFEPREKEVLLKNLRPIIRPPE